MTVLPNREDVRAMLAQALAEAAAKGGRRLTAIHLELFDSSPDTERTLRGCVAELAAGTPAQGTRVVVFSTPSRFICWNCCGLRFESPSSEAICPNCGDLGMLIPPDVTFALDHVDIGD